MEFASNARFALRFASFARDRVPGSSYLIINAARTRRVLEPR